MTRAWAAYDLTTAGVKAVTPPTNFKNATLNSLATRLANSPIKIISIYDVTAISIAQESGKSNKFCGYRPFFEDTNEVNFSDGVGPSWTP